MGRSFSGYRGDVIALREGKGKWRVALLRKGDVQVPKVHIVLFLGMTVRGCFEGRIALGLKQASKL